MLLFYGLRNLPQKCQPSAINIKYRSDQAGNWYFELYVHKWGNFKPLNLSNESRF